MLDTDRRLNLLCAYPYMSSRAVVDLIVANQGRIRFLLDSGAFTAWKAGKTIKLDDYCRFLEKLPFKPWRYFTLDVVGNPVATRSNYETMLKRGFAPVPIFTRGDSIKELDGYYKSSDVVGIGGLVGTTGNKGFINGIMKHIGKRRCHWLGLTSLPFLKTYRPYMCDTASWESGAQFAIFRLYVGNGRTVPCNKVMFAKRPPDEIVEAIEGYGMKAKDLAKVKNWSGGYSVNRALNAASGVRLTLDLQRHIKTLMFLGATTTHAITLLLRGFEFEQSRRSQ